MVVLVQEFTAAQLALGVDIFDLEPFVNHKMAKRNRRVKWVLITGGAAAADATFDLYYSDRLQASGLFNVDTGLENLTQMKIPIVGGDWCHVDEPIKLVVTEAGDTNPYHIAVGIS